MVFPLSVKIFAMAVPQLPLPSIPKVIICVSCFSLIVLAFLVLGLPKDIINCKHLNLNNENQNNKKLFYNPNLSTASCAAIWLASFLLNPFASAISSPSTVAPMVNNLRPFSNFSCRVSNSRDLPFLFAHP